MNEVTGHSHDAPAEWQPRNRLAVLDCFRGVAILAVMGFHYAYRWGPFKGYGTQLYHSDFTYAFLTSGRLGVEFFFIISGFVIFMTLEKCPTFIEFAIRRFARIYPTFIFCMTLTFIVLQLFPNEFFKAGLTDYLVGFTMVSTDIGAKWVDGAYWSLLIELKFYFWIALLYYGLRANFLPVWTGFCLAAAGFHFISPGLAGHLLPDTFMCFFVAGMGFYRQFKEQKIDRACLTLFGTALALYVCFWHGQTLTTHLCVLAMIVLFELFVTQRLEWLARTKLGYIGLVSYPLYLIHQDIGVMMIGALNGPGILPGGLTVLAVGAIVIAMAALIHHFIEIPSQKASRRFLEARLIKGHG